MEIGKREIKNQTGVGLRDRVFITEFIIGKKCIYCEKRGDIENSGFGFQTQKYCLKTDGLRFQI